MRHGRLIAVVGPSGVGKDSVMAGIARAVPNIKLVRRTITRTPELGGEDYRSVNVAGFQRAVGEGAFCLHWDAHGLNYGLPSQVLDDVKAGADCLANVSRGVLSKACAVFPELAVVNITASEEILTQRLTRRGRETAEDIRERLGTARKPIPHDLNVINLCNDGALEDTVVAAIEALQLETTNESIR